MKFIKSLKLLILLFLKPKTFASRSTITFKKWFHNINCLVFSKEYKTRRNVVESLNNTLGIPEISEGKGYAKINTIDKELINEVIQESHRLIKENLSKNTSENSAYRHLVTIPIRGALTPDNVFMKFALDQSLLKTIGKYIGMLPVIENIMIWYSPNEKDIEGSSQYYHLDGQDVRTMQVFIFLDDIDKDCGPFTFVDASASEKIANFTKYKKSGDIKRFDDEMVENMIQPNESHVLTGKKGEVYICDTDRCFHYGSRMAKKPRQMIVFQYYSPFAFTVPWKWWEGLPYAKMSNLQKFNKIERMVLGAKEN
jgi:hypothetical protein